MEKKFQEEWFNLQAEAREILRRGFPGAPRDQRLFQFLVLPSFDSSRCWELYERKVAKGNVELIAVTAIWHIRNDVEKFDPLARLKYPETLTPTIASIAGRIEEALALKVMEELSGISISPQPGKAGIYLDGTGYELTLGAGNDSSRFEWHDEGPSHWETLRNWAIETASKLENALRSSVSDNTSPLREGTKVAGDSK